MWRSIASNAVSILIVALFLIGGVILWGRGQYEHPGPLTQAICLQVERGSNFRRVSRDLEAEGAVTSASIFRMGADYAGKTADLKAGSYLVEPKASMEDIVDIVTRGGASTCGTEVIYRIGVNRLNTQVRELDPTTNRFVERASFEPGEDETPEFYIQVKENADTRYRIALAEGVTSWQVVTALREMDVLQGAAEEVPAEGTLAPDSYEVRKGDTRADVLAEMADRQEKNVSAAWEARDSALPLETPEELVILASIIEKETGVAEEREQCGLDFCQSVEPGHAAANRPDGDLWPHARTGCAGPRIAPFRTAQQYAVEYLCDRRAAADTYRKSRTCQSDGGWTARGQRLRILCCGRDGRARLCRDAG